MSVKLECPFHIKTALSDIKKLKSHVDLLIAVSDARSLQATSVYSSLLKDFSNSGIKILHLISKFDLGDPKELKELEKISFNFKDPKSRIPILKLIKQSLQEKISRYKDYKPHFQVLIVGVPNTGKSTLINLLKGKKVALVENIPGKTRHISKFPIGNNIWVYDSPGIFIHKKLEQNLADKLFLVNAIPANVRDYSELMKKAYSYLLDQYLLEIKKILDISEAPEEYELFLEKLADKYNYKISGGKLDLERAEKKFLAILREGKFRLSWDKE
ncbi:GTPase [Candidatus Mycoplasma haematohominis]|uniref:Ribosome biogenesis GTPase A n=1 Tax=Candidatus Mycoplasma haematohominis TaxID=1494318 RepID=A0A478FPK9_9MOLU|nr:GTPase [Candidatus Mycoplasma haemohominis]GCE63303.1 ribosome biogenesis GTPase A [Candidatus Mycoplasma haemohominis]